MFSTMSGQGPCIIYTMYEDGSGNLWASVLNTGVVRIHLASGKITLFNSSNGLSVNKVRCMLHDREGNMIIGTSGEGLDVFSGERFVYYNKRNGSADNQVWSICKEKKPLLVWYQRRDYHFTIPAQKPGSNTLRWEARKACFSLHSLYYQR